MERPRSHRATNSPVGPSACSMQVASLRHLTNLTRQIAAGWPQLVAHVAACRVQRLWEPSQAANCTAQCASGLLLLSKPRAFQPAPPPPPSRRHWHTTPPRFLRDTRAGWCSARPLRTQLPVKPSGHADVKRVARGRLRAAPTHIAGARHGAAAAYVRPAAAQSAHNHPDPGRRHPGPAGQGRHHSSQRYPRRGHRGALAFARHRAARACCPPTRWLTPWPLLSGHRRHQRKRRPACTP